MALESLSSFYGYKSVITYKYTMCMYIPEIIVKYRNACTPGSTTYLVTRNLLLITYTGLVTRVHSLHRV